MTELSWIPVDSSNVAAIAYADGELFVQYNSGGTYVYWTVPERVFEALLNVGSKGTFVNVEVKPLYSCRKL
jgi:hypothetical protein